MGEKERMKKRFLAFILSASVALGTISTDNVCAQDINVEKIQTEDQISGENDLNKIQTEDQINEETTGSTYIVRDVGDYKISFNDEEKIAILYRYDGEEKVLNIPGTFSYNGVPYKLTQIGLGWDHEQQWVFRKNHTVEEVIIPESVERIESEAFAHNDKLKKVVWKSGDNSPANQQVCRKAFFACTNLTHVDIAKNVVRIGDYAFDYCDKITDIKLPDTLNRIGTCAFYGTAIESVDIPKSVNEIQSYAFKNCADLKNVNWEQGKGNITLGEGVFEFDTALKDIKLPSNATAISRFVFRGCDNLEKITFAKNISGDENNAAKLVLDSYCLAECPKLKTVIFENGVKNIKNNVFANDIRLSNIKLTDGLKGIGRYSFTGCASLKQINIPASVTKIEKSVFGDCTALKSVKWDSGEEDVTIDDRAFYNCSKLKNVILPKKCVSLGEEAFWKCTALKEAYIPSGITCIGKDAFKSCAAALQIIGDKQNAVVSEYVKANKLKFVDKVKVPQKVRVKAGNKNKATITWQKIPGIKSYTVYQKSGKKSVKAGTVTDNKFSVNASGAKKKYVVVADGEFYGEKTQSAQSKAVEAGASLKKLKAVKVSKKTKTALKLSWKKDKKATGYYIYQKSGKKWKKIKTLKSNKTTSFKISKLKRNKSYTFCVQSYYNKKNTKYACSKFDSKGVTAKTKK